MQEKSTYKEKKSKDEHHEQRAKAPELILGPTSVSLPFAGGSRSALAGAGREYLRRQERGGSMVELPQESLHQEPPRACSRHKNYRVEYAQHGELKMPEIVDRRDKVRLQKLHHVKNIYLKNSEPLNIKFERFGRNFD